jgi:mannose-6-phosphate isomerase-like protein (cupin superfamily)
VGQSEPIVSKYETPSAEQLEGRQKIVVRMGSTPTVKTFVQCVNVDGGENNLHAHPNTDGFWFVLTGRSRWYGEDDQLLAELGRHESIMIPRGTKYWFEASGDQPLEVLHVACTRDGVDARSDRVDFAPRASSARPGLAVDAPARQLGS